MADTKADTKSEAEVVMMRFILFFLLLTGISGTSMSLAEGAEKAKKAVKPEKKTLELRDGDTVDFHLLKFIGEDGYPQYGSLNPKGPIGNALMSLRCTERAYDVGPNGKNVVWTYNEIMIFDENGNIIPRKEPRANVKSEVGFNFRFKTFEECEKAAAGAVDGAICTLQVRLLPKSGTAEYVSSKCSPR